MSKKYLTQWAKAAEEWQDANNNMLEAVEEMIKSAFNEFCKDGEDDLGVKDVSSEHVKLYQHDGELEYSYEVKYVDIEDNTIIVISEDDYGNEDSRELWDLDYGDAFSVGCAFNANMDKILGTTKTYKDMVK